MSNQPILNASYSAFSGAPERMRDANHRAKLFGAFITAARTCRKAE